MKIIRFHVINRTGTQAQLPRLLGRTLEIELNFFVYTISLGDATLPGQNEKKVKLSRVAEKSVKAVAGM